MRVHFHIVSVYHKPNRWQYMPINYSHPSYIISTLTSSGIFVLIIHRNFEVKCTIIVEFKQGDGQWKKYDSTHTEDELMQQLNDLSNDFLSHDVNSYDNHAPISYHDHEPNTSVATPQVYVFTNLCMGRAWSLSVV